MRTRHINLFACLLGCFLLNGCAVERFQSPPADDSNTPSQVNLPSPPLKTEESVPAEESASAIETQVQFDDLQDIEESESPTPPVDPVLGDDTVTDTVTDTVIIDTVTDTDTDTSIDTVTDIVITDINSQELSIDSSVTHACEEISDKLASVSLDDCHFVDFHTAEIKSVLGKPLLTKTFEPIAGRPNLGRVTLIGGVHGDELSSISIIFKWLKTLNEHHSGIFHWTVVPLVNPDGALRELSQRMNANGVDLNRNLPTPGWDSDSQAYWVSTGNNPRRYPGPRAASEPETRWLLDHIETFKPDVIVSVHSPHNLVDFDAPSRKIAPKSIGILYANHLGTYPGSLGFYGGVFHGIPVITLELPHSWALPNEGDIDRMWVDLVSWLKRNLPKVKAQRFAISK